MIAVHDLLPGRDLDRLIIEYVFGGARVVRRRDRERRFGLRWRGQTAFERGRCSDFTEPEHTWGGIPEFSTDDAAAHRVLDHVSKRFDVTVHVGKGGAPCSVDVHVPIGRRAWGAGPKFPLAMCRAALVAKAPDHFT